MTTKQDMERQIEDAIRDLNFSEPQPEPTVHAIRSANKRPDNARQIAIGVAVLLLVAIFVVAGFKAFVNRNSDVVAQLPPMQPQQPFYPPVQSSSELDQLRNTVASLKTEVAELKAEAAKTDLRSKQNREKIQVLGIVTNENSIIAKNGYPRQYYMMVSRNWLLQQSPKYLQISESDRRYIENLVDDGKNNYGGVLLQVIEGEENTLPAGHSPAGTSSIQLPRNDLLQLRNWLYTEDPVLADLGPTMKSFRDRLESVEAATRRMGDKVQVLGYVTNENASIMRNNYPRGDVIMLTSNWGLTAIPKHCTLDEAGKRFLHGLK